jgi:hypothetical protein
MSLAPSTNLLRFASNFCKDAQESTQEQAIKTKSVGSLGNLFSKQVQTCHHKVHQETDFVIKSFNSDGTLSGFTPGKSSLKAFRVPAEITGIVSSS